MKKTKNIHNLYKEWEKANKEGFFMKQIVDKWQYIYTSEKGEISMVKFLDYFGDGQDFYEIYSLKGDLFDDVERYNTMEEAEKRISDLLVTE